MSDNNLLCTMHEENRNFQSHNTFQISIIQNTTHYTKRVGLKTRVTDRREKKGPAARHPEPEDRSHTHSDTHLTTIPIPRAQFHFFSPSPSFPSPSSVPAPPKFNSIDFTSFFTTSTVAAGPPASRANTFPSLFTTNTPRVVPFGAFLKPRAAINVAEGSQSSEYGSFCFSLNVVLALPLSVLRPKMSRPEVVKSVCVSRKRQAWVVPGWVG